MDLPTFVLVDLRVNLFIPVPCYWRLRSHQRSFGRCDLLGRGDPVAGCEELSKWRTTGVVPARCSMKRSKLESLKSQTHRTRANTIVVLLTPALVKMFRRNDKRLK
jgi:hypothetical protein